MLYTKLLLAHAALGNHAETFDGIREGQLKILIACELSKTEYFRFNSRRTDCHIDDTYRAEILSNRTVCSNRIEIEFP